MTSEDLETYLQNANDGLATGSELLNSMLGTCHGGIQREKKIVTTEKSTFRERRPNLRTSRRHKTKDCEEDFVKNSKEDFRADDRVKNGTHDFIVASGDDFDSPRLPFPLTDTACYGTNQILDCYLCSNDMRRTTPRDQLENVSSETAVSLITPRSVQAVGCVRISRTQSGKLLTNIKSPSGGYFNMDDRKCDHGSRPGHKTCAKTKKDIVVQSPVKDSPKQCAPTRPKRLTKSPNLENAISTNADVSTTGKGMQSMLDQWVLSQPTHVADKTSTDDQSAAFTTSSCPLPGTERDKSTNSSDDFTLALEQVPDQYLYKGTTSKPCPHLEFSKEMQISASTSESDSMKSAHQGTHHHAEVGQYLQDLYKRDQLTDMTIRVGQYTFTAHRAVLACHSPVLATRLMHQKVPVNEITLDEVVSPSGFHDVIRYMYTGKLSIGIDNVMELLNVACRLEMKKLQDICQDVIRELGPADLLTVWQNARKQGITDNTEAILHDLARSSTDIFHSQQFLQLEVGPICELLSRDDLNIGSELDVALAAVRWLQHQADESHLYAVNVMTCVRLPLMTTDDLFTLTKSARFLYEHEEIRHMIYYANWYLCNLARNKSLFLDEHPPSPRRTPPTNIKPTPKNKKSTSPIHPKVREPSPAVHCPGHSPAVHSSPGHSPAMHSPGHSPAILSHRFQSDTNVMRKSPGLVDENDTAAHPSKESTDTVNSSTSSRYCSPISDILLPCILAIGGHDPERKDSTSPGNCVVMYDIKRNQWTELPHLPEPRTHHAVACLHDQVYVTGGRDPRHIEEGTACNPRACNTVFCLDTLSASWRVISPMQHRRIHHSLISVVGRLFAMCGQNADNPLLSSMESYDTKTNTWSDMAPLSYGVIGAAASVFFNCVAVAGGFGGQTSDLPTQHQVLSNVQRYSTAMNRWIEMAPLLTPRCYANLAFVKFKLIICGGLTYLPSQAKYEAVDTVEMYDDDSDTWSRITYLRLPRYDAGCCVYGSRFYIIGGMYEDGNQATPDVQSYNLIKDKWNKDVDPLPQATCAVGCVTLT